MGWDENILENDDWDGEGLIVSEFGSCGVVLVDDDGNNVFFE